MSDMPREEVERLMRKSGMSFHLGMPHDSVITQMIRFSSMLRDEILEASEHAIECAMEFEREACAKVCENEHKQRELYFEQTGDGMPTVGLLVSAAAIRARGAK